MNRRPRSSKVPIIGYELSSGPAASSTLNPGGTCIAPSPVTPAGSRTAKSTNDAAALNKTVAISPKLKRRKFDLLKMVPLRACVTRNSSGLRATAPFGSDRDPCCRLPRALGNPFHAHERSGLFLAGERAELHHEPAALPL